MEATIQRGFWKIGVLFAVVTLLLAPGVRAQEGRSIGEPGRTDKPSKKANPLKNVYFGE